MLFPEFCSPQPAGGPQLQTACAPRAAQIPKPAFTRSPGCLSRTAQEGPFPAELPPPPLQPLSFQRWFSQPGLFQHPRSRSEGANVKKSSSPRHCKDYKRLNQEPPLPFKDGGGGGGGGGGRRESKSPRDHRAGSLEISAGRSQEDPNSLPGDPSSPGGRGKPQGNAV